MKRMRTIGALATHYKSMDPDTAITAHFIRDSILKNKVPFTTAGSKRLIAVEDFDAFLSGEASTEQPDLQSGKIRLIS